MKVNIGSADKIIRILVGLGLIAWGIFGKTWWGALGIIPLLTAMMGWCPLYTMCGANTCSTKPAK